MDHTAELGKLVDLGLAVCVCGDFLNEHDDDGQCLVCQCAAFKQDVDSDSYYISQTV